MHPPPWKAMKIDLRVKQPPARKAQNFHHNRLAFICLHLISSLSPCLARCSIIAMLTHTRTHQHKNKPRTWHHVTRALTKKHSTSWECENGRHRSTQIMGKHMSHRDHLLGKRQVSLYANEQVIHVTTNRRHRHTVDPSCTSKRLSKIAMLCLSEDYLLHFMYSKQYLQSQENLSYFIPSLNINVTNVWVISSRVNTSCCLGSKMFWG